MKIDLSDMITSINRELTAEAEVALDAFESRMGRFPIRVRPLSLHIRNQENERLLIQCDVDMEADIPCGRCLENVRTPICFSVNRELAIRDGVLVDEEMENADYLTGAALDVERFLYTEILVNWPVNVLCREDCRGICKTCGKNLNREACGCRKTEPDIRMAAIQDIFNKYKEV